MRLRSIVLFLSVLLCCAAPAAERPLRVFFIGNSYTFVNNLPGVLAGLADAAGGRKIQTAQYTPGGWTLEAHFKDGKAVAAMSQGEWDVVVLQDHSLMPVGNPALTREFAAKLDAAIKDRGAKTVFYLTWARRNNPAMQEKLTETYFGIAKQLKARVAPVGIAWQRALKEDPKLVLHAPDGSHPSVEGSYLAACVFYATLLGKSPEGLPAEVKKGGKTILTLDPQVARRLQTIAWRTVQERS
jgi:hypothetical protein